MHDLFIYIKKIVKHLVL